MPARSPRQPTLQPTRRSTRQSTRRPNSGSSAAPPSRDPLRALHDAEVYLVLEYLDAADIVCAGAVCRQWMAYIDNYISTTAMRRFFPQVWDDHKHLLPLNRIELAREYRRQACGYHALRTGKATAGRRYSNVRLYDIREPYVAWSDGRVRFEVENLFSTKAAWQGTNALYCSSTTTRLDPTVILTRIESLCLATTLDLLFLRVVPQYPNGAHKYRDLMYSIPKDRLVWSKTRWSDGWAHRHGFGGPKVQVGRRVYFSDPADEVPFARELQFVAEDVATGEELYRRSWAHANFELHILKTQDLIVLYERHRASIVAGDTGDIIGVVNLCRLGSQASAIEGGSTLIFRFRTNQHHVQYQFYHLRRHPNGGTDESSDHHGSGGRCSLEELQQMQFCVRRWLPGREVFQRNMRDRVSVAGEDSTVALRQEWRIRVLREETASAACACVQKAPDALDNEPVGLVPLAPFEAATPPRLKPLSQYRVEHSALITLPPKSNAGSHGRKKANTNDGPRPRRPFQSETNYPRALHCIFLNEHRMDFMSQNSDLYILSFRAQW
ncbi:MAG: hypothetical protein M1826_006593 [Phylliscum demangeonii]|nr:MAG: hypothetical protein M1826_006593 [Phylliscum demangeonii]